MLANETPETTINYSDYSSIVEALDDRHFMAKINGETVPVTFLKSRVGRDENWYLTVVFNAGDSVEIDVEPEDTINEITAKLELQGVEVDLMSPISLDMLLEV